jgi:hypothetical protein
MIPPASRRPHSSSPMVVRNLGSTHSIRLSAGRVSRGSSRNIEFGDVVDDVRGRLQGGVVMRFDDG